MTFIDYFHHTIVIFIVVIISPAQSLLASLESIQFISNVIFVKFVHKEVVTAQMLLASTSIVAGNILVVNCLLIKLSYHTPSSSSSSSTNTATYVNIDWWWCDCSCPLACGFQVIFSKSSTVLYTSHDMKHLYATNTIYHIYLAAAFVMFCVAKYTYHTYHKARMVERKMLWKHAFVEPFCFAVSSAIIGTQAVLSSKCMSMLLQVHMPPLSLFSLLSPLSSSSPFLMFLS